MLEIVPVIANLSVLEMEFNKKSNQVEYVILPSRISRKIKLKSLKISELVSKSLNHVGLIAVELFCTHNDDVLVNEMHQEFTTVDI